MQFHLDGFRPGDPAISRAPNTQNSSPGQVDVLIVGCGPAGLTLAAQLAAFPDIVTMIVESKDGPLQVGQADGIACRTMEMFEVGAHRTRRHAILIIEFAKGGGIPQSKRPRRLGRTALLRGI